MSAVWVVRPPVMTLQWPVRYFSDEDVARAVLQSHHEFGVDSTLTRETLLTPAQAAVIAAAKDYCEASTRNGAFQLTDAERARPKLCAAVAFLRAQEGA